MVTSDSRMPTTPTRIPTRRVLGSAACSGLTSISGMTHILEITKSAGHPRRGGRGGLGAHRSARSFEGVEARIGARDTEDAPADPFGDFGQGGGRGHEFAD